GKYVIEFFGQICSRGSRSTKRSKCHQCVYSYRARFTKSTAPDKGTTMNIGTVEGGTTQNTVPDYVKTQN
ncbi:hypothetical protein AAUPMC_09892, partial [Pasteurella multocida subsp. multocida str. Anand1_cattle]